MAPTFNLNNQLAYLRRKQALLQTFTGLAANEGYVLFETDDFESYESFKRINDRVNPDDMVKVTDTGGEVLVLRPDVTTQVIDQLIPRWDGLEPLKLYYDTTVYTHSESGIEGKRQFGVEYISTDTQASDKAMVSLATKMLNETGEAYVFEIGNQRFLNALFDSLDLSVSELNTLKELITYKNQFELEKFIETLALNANETSLLTNLLTLEGDLKTIEAKLEPYTLNDAMKRAVEEIRDVLPSLNGADVTVDLALLSEFDYYAGIVFRAYIPRASKAVLKGGRYAPERTQGSAIGFSVDIAPLLKGRDPLYE
ncbi:MAG: ATP phosphoribosyltransferase regulatory subunit [Bacillota bacterium]